MDVNSKLSLKEGVRIYSDKIFADACDIGRTFFETIYGVKVSDRGALDITIEYREMASEEFSVNADSCGIKIYAADLKGAIYAFSTLIEHVRFDNEFYIPHFSLTDKPYKGFRGIHVYLPSRENIVAFKRIIDVLALLKMNTMILEVGGGMEYKRHPEINEAWEKFCHMLDTEFPGFGGSRSLQGSDFYWKDSIHTELGGGSYLSQDEVRDLIAHARRRGIKVIPEAQAFSHSYYLTIPHREIAEMQNDAFPDTYCPLNEDSYKLYFDVAEEVIEVFEPDVVSIGHDELRVLGWCQRCRGKSGHELASYEINRLHDFYKERGIRIMMWGDVAQHFENYLGKTVGGVEKDLISKGVRYFRPATYKCIDSLPNDIYILDWYHSLGKASQDKYLERNFEVIYGNLHGSSFCEWDERSSSDSILGAEVSTWCATDERTFGQDGIFFELAFSSYILWNEGCSNEKYDEINKNVLPRMPMIRALMRGYAEPTLGNYEATVLFAPKEDSGKTISLSSASIPNISLGKALAAFGDKLSGVQVIGENVIARPDTTLDSILFLHNTEGERPFVPSYELLDKSPDAAGTYAVIYEDGDFALANVNYGREIGTKSFKLERHRRRGNAKGGEIDIDIGTANENASLAAYYDHNFTWCESLCYFTTPIITDGDTAFLYEWKNPKPDKKIKMIKGISVSKNPDLEFTLYGIVGIKK